ncbi:hypothetical protein IGK74_002362 [Enterococcus sp. AZ150]|uniref:hypothetical protein n=1 Tax=Enterococcus sp. AZ150 TaxID=2774866 RepID=UPI003F21A99B
MKTSEFIEKVEALEFVNGVVEKVHLTFGSFDKRLIVMDETESILSTVSIEDEFSIVTRFYSYSSLSIHQRKKLFDLLTEYASTPIKLRKDKTIEEKAREYMKECMNDNLNFYSCVDNLEYSRSEMRESEIYDWYRDNSNEFVKLWCEVAECES